MKIALHQYYNIMVMKLLLLQIMKIQLMNYIKQIQIINVCIINYGLLVDKKFLIYQVIIMILMLHIMFNNLLIVLFNFGKMGDL